MGLCSRRDTWDAVLRGQGWRPGSLWGLLGLGRGCSEKLRDFSGDGCS